MINMRILGLTLDSDSKAPILVMQQDGGSEILPIWIGTAEALSISVVLGGTNLDRPVTHEAMLNSIEALGGKVSSLDIVSVQDGIYYAELAISQGDKVARIDCRPSDGIAVAIRCQAPIRVSPLVLADTAASRSTQRGEDLLTSFNIEQPTTQANLTLQNMEAASRYKM